MCNGLFTVLYYFVIFSESSRFLQIGFIMLGFINLGSSYGLIKVDLGAGMARYQIRRPAYVDRVLSPQNPAFYLNLFALIVNFSLQCA